MEAPRPPHARLLLGTALTVGIAGDTLLKAAPWGVNFTLWGALVFGAVLFMSKLARDPLPRESWLIAALGGLCLGCVSLRDSGALTGWNVAATLLAAGVLAARGESLRRLSITVLLWTLLLHTAHSIAGTAMLIGEDLKNARPSRRLVPWGAAAKGAMLTLPPLLLFGGLLTSADARFEYLIKEVLDIDAWSIVTHLLLIGVLAWITGGFLRGRFLAREISLPHGVRIGASAIGAVETGILLGSLNILFLAFVVVQGSYFFGGNAMVLQTPGLTYAGYARRGFFELLAVLCFAIPVLLGTEWIVRKDRVLNVLLFRVLAGAMIVLLMTILASAVQRLWLYAAAFGLTEARVHAAATLLWLCFLLIWFALTVLRGQRDRFLFGGIVGGFVVLLALNVLNPDALVVRVNLERSAEGTAIDSRHALSLSADAVPVVLRHLDALSPEDRDRFARSYLARYDTTGADWRTWNRSRAEASRLVRAHRSMLRQALLPSPPQDACAPR